MSNVLVTGGAGFIGAHVVNHLIEESHTVIVLDDLSGGFEENVNKKAVFRKGSILNKSLIEELFQEYKFDYVYHLAAYAAEGLSHFIRRFNYNNNLIGSINLINESIKHKVKCFIFTSSIAVYGSGTLPLQEEATPQPEDPYGIAKYSVEMDLKCANEMFGLDYLIFRPHNVYGPYQNIGDKYRNVIGIFMNQLLNAKELSIFGDGEQTRAFTYIDDVAPIMVQAIKHPETYNTIYNIGADKQYSINQLCDIVTREMGIEGKKRYLESRHEVVHAYCSHDRIRNAYGISNQEVDLTTGVKLMANWVKETGSRTSSPFENIEIEEKLPPVWT